MGYHADLATALVKTLDYVEDIYNDDLFPPKKEITDAGKMRKYAFILSEFIEDLDEGVDFVDAANEAKRRLYNLLADKRFRQWSEWKMLKKTIYHIECILYRIERNTRS